MEKKQYVLRTMALQVVKHSISMEEIKEEVAAVKREMIAKQETFDLLIVVDGQERRVPFDVGKDACPVAIFPFKDQDIYISLDESGECLYPRSEQSNLPSVGFMEEVMDVRPELNERLRQLGKPILSGQYWVRGYSLDICYWYVLIRKNEIKRDFGDAEAVGKVRLVGFYKVEA